MAARGGRHGGSNVVAGLKSPSKRRKGKESCGSGGKTHLESRHNIRIKKGGGPWRTSSGPWGGFSDDNVEKGIPKKLGTDKEWDGIKPEPGAGASWAYERDSKLA